MFVFGRIHDVNVNAWKRKMKNPPVEKTTVFRTHALSFFNLLFLFFYESRVQQILRLGVSALLRLKTVYLNVFGTLQTETTVYELSHKIKAYYYSNFRKKIVL